MGFVRIMFFALILCLRPLNCGAEDTFDDTKALVGNINQRYDDFFRRLREVDEREQMRESEASEIKRLRQQHAEQVEAARSDYVKSRKKQVIDPKLEQDWNHQEEQWVEQNKMARHRFVMKKQELENVLKRGRRIPENLEYDLQE